MIIKITFFSLLLLLLLWELFIIIQRALLARLFFVVVAKIILVNHKNFNDFLKFKLNGENAFDAMFKGGRGEIKSFDTCLRINVTK